MITAHNQPAQGVYGLVDGLSSEERTALFSELSSRYPEEVGAIATRDVMLIPRLTPEQEERSSAIQIALARKFHVTTEDFSIVSTTAETTEGDRRFFTIAYTATHGLSTGNENLYWDRGHYWESIFDEDNAAQYMVKVGNQLLDSRAGMTSAVYQAFINDAAANKLKPLPDSPRSDNEEAGAWTSTWLTGDASRMAIRKDSRVACVDHEGKIIWKSIDPHGGTWGMRFRPAIAI